MALASLGMFVFELRSAPFQEFQRQAEQRWPSNSRVGRRPGYQYLGPGEETVNLSGVLYPELTGGPVNLKTLRNMADRGKAWTLVDGQGYVHGQFVIQSVEETQTIFFRDGAARRIEFSVSLLRVDESCVNVLGMLGDLLASVASLV